MIKKKLLLILFCGISFLTNSYAQNNNSHKAYDDFKKQAMQKYNDFRKEANEQYAAFLKQAWEQYQALPAIPKPKDETVPPITIPKEEKDKPIESNPIPIKDIVTPPAPMPQPTPVAPIEEQPQPKEHNIDFVYCGTECQVRMNQSIKLSLSDCDNNSLSKTWSLLSEDGMMNNTIRDCLNLRNSMNLCDWAYLNMLTAFARHIYGDSNEANMLAAYIYCQSGYKMRLGRNSNNLYILFGSNHIIYECSYFKLDDTNFYPLNCQIEQLEICDTSYPQEKCLSLYIPQNQLFAYNATPTRALSSKRYPDVQANVQVNKNMIDFYNTYPTSEINDNFMTRWAMYANVPLDEKVKRELYPTLKEAIKGTNQQEAANKLLNWVQTAFVYEYDDKVWGGDRAFFAEETLYYPYCDCEDRAILYTRLIRDLLGLQTILVYYPGHLACAVCFTDEVSGDYILLDDKRFLITDPTYIGAPVGKTMPDMDNTQASVIILD